MENFLDKITELESLIVGVRRENAELEQRTNSRIKDVLDLHFNPFQELEIKVSGTSAYFCLEGKEIFSLYFYPKFREVTRLEISYYSSSSQSEFELERLICLGKVAKIVKDRSEIILKEIDEARKKDLDRSSELFSIQNEYEKEIAEYKRRLLFRRKLEIELLLMGDGVVFGESVYIEFKRSYTMKVKSLKMINVSKSGKTCTMVYSTRDGFSTREENCNVENILNQVVYFYNNIVQELLPA